MVQFELDALDEECLEVFRMNKDLVRRKDAVIKSEAESKRKSKISRTIHIRGQKRCSPVQTLEALCDLHGVDDIDNASNAQRIALEKELEGVMKHYRLMPNDVRGADKVFSKEKIEKWSS